MAAQYTARLVQDPCHQRAFQNCVRKVEIEQSVDVVGPGPCIPLVVDELGICRLGARAAAGHARDAKARPEWTLARQAPVTPPW